jgi:hypothetical protein
VTALVTLAPEPWQPPFASPVRVACLGQVRRLSDGSVLACFQSDVPSGPHPLLYGSDDPVVVVIGSLMVYADVAAGITSRTGGPAYLPKSADFAAALAGGDWLAGTEESAAEAARRWQAMTR